MLYYSLSLVHRNSLQQNKIVLDNTGIWGSFAWIISMLFLDIVCICSILRLIKCSQELILWKFILLHLFLLYFLSLSKVCKFKACSYFFQTPFLTQSKLSQSVQDYPKFLPRNESISKQAVWTHSKCRSQTISSILSMIICTLCTIFLFQLKFLSQTNLGYLHLWLHLAVIKWERCTFNR